MKRVQRGFESWLLAVEPASPTRSHDRGSPGEAPRLLAQAHGRGAASEHALLGTDLPAQEPGEAAFSEAPGRRLTTELRKPLSPGLSSERYQRVCERQDDASEGRSADPGLPAVALTWTSGRS